MNNKHISQVSSDIFKNDAFIELLDQQKRYEFVGINKVSYDDFYNYDLDEKLMYINIALGFECLFKKNNEIYDREDTEHPINNIDDYALDLNYLSGADCEGMFL